MPPEYQVPSKARKVQVGIKDNGGIQKEKEIVSFIFILPNSHMILLISYDSYDMMNNILNLKFRRTTRVKEQVVLMQVLMPKMLFVVSINMLTQKPVQSNFGTMNAVTKTRVHSLLLPRLIKMNMEIGPKKTQKILLHDPLMKQLVVLTL